MKLRYCHTDFEKLPGVVEVESGCASDFMKERSYEAVSAGAIGIRAECKNSR
jgi:peptide methionine sulfoxide reductase MsrA